MKCILYKSIAIGLLLFGLIQGACVADPWPEPDDMREDGDSKSDGAGGDGDGDGDGDHVPAGNDNDNDSQDLDDDDRGGDTDAESPNADTGSLAGDTGLGTDLGDGHEGSDSDAYSGSSGTDSKGSDSCDSEEDTGGMDAGVSEGDTEVDSVPDWGGDAGLDGAVSDSVAGLNQVYCSAPGPDGFVTVVGLAGTVLMQGEVEAIHRGESFSLSVGQDGGFVGRLPAGPTEPVEIVVTFVNSDPEWVTVMTGGLEGSFVGTGITGAGGTVTNLPDESQIIIHGQGERLSANHLVIGGNVDAATGRGAPVSCSNDACEIDLLIPGRSGDDVDIFLVPIGKHWGNTDAQTIRVP